MKKFSFLVISAVLVFALGYVLDSSSGPNFQPKEETKVTNTLISLPRFKFKTLEGKEVSIESLKGSKLILNFWASWCGPCAEEFPIMIDIVKNNSDIKLLAISNDEELMDIKKFLKELNKKTDYISSKNVIFAWDPNKDISSEHFNVLRLPETFIVNKNLEITKKIIGSSDWLSGEAKSYLNK